MQTATEYRNVQHAVTLHYHNGKPMTFGPFITGLEAVQWRDDYLASCYGRGVFATEITEFERPFDPLEVVSYNIVWKE